MLYQSTFGVYWYFFRLFIKLRTVLTHRLTLPVLRTVSALSLESVQAAYFCKKEIIISSSISRKHRIS